MQGALPAERGRWGALSCMREWRLSGPPAVPVAQGRIARVRLWGASLLLYGSATLAGAAQAAQLPEGAQPGDLIFREGTELVSEAVMAVDAGGFSHVGMLVGSPGHWQVVHSTPSEVPGRPDGVVVDDLAFFADPVRARRAVVYHVQGATPAQRDAALAHALAAQGTPFSFTRADSGYCTTLVWQAWRDAGLDLEVAFTPLALPLVAGDYLLPGVLSQSTHLQALPDRVPGATPNAHAQSLRP